MMRIARLLLVVAAPLLLVAALGSLLAYPAKAGPSSACEPDGVQPSGAYYRICMPTGTWNGDLVIYAHGYVAFNKPITIPEDQLQLPGGASLPELINSLGFAFATTSYRMNGLAVETGVDDLVQLANIFSDTHGLPNHILLTGVSEGGLITALAIERRPDVFDGGLAACGPIGDFGKQINYFGDFRVLFDYFFPGVMPSSPIRDWIKDYHGSAQEQAFKRKFSFSDRIRYYWTYPTFKEAFDKMLKTLNQKPLPDALLKQYVPELYPMVEKTGALTPEKILLLKIPLVLDDYAQACASLHDRRLTYWSV